MAETYLYLDKTELSNNWRGVIVYPSRSVDTGETERYIELLTSQRIRRVYLDELGNTEPASIGIETVKLVVEAQETAATKARELLELVQQEITDEVQERELIQLIETIVIYKFPQKSRKEIEQMLGLGEIKQTKVYQEALAEGKLEGKIEGKIEARLEAVPRLLALGLTIEQVASALTLDPEAVRQASQQQQSQNTSVSTPQNPSPENQA